MSDLTSILAENQKEMLKLILPAVKKSPDLQNLRDSDSEAGNISVACTSRPIKKSDYFQKHFDNSQHSQD